jgi:hypothetical protein
MISAYGIERMMEAAGMNAPVTLDGKGSKTASGVEEIQA